MRVSMYCYHETSAIEPKSVLKSQITFFYYFLLPFVFIRPLLLVFNSKQSVLFAKKTSNVCSPQKQNTISSNDRIGLKGATPIYTAKDHRKNLVIL